MTIYKKEKNKIAKLLKTRNVTKSKYEKALANYEFSMYRVEQYDTDIKSEKISSQVTEKKIQIKETINSVDFKTEKEVKIIDDNSELSEEVEFDDDNELNEVIEDDISLEKE